MLPTEDTNFLCQIQLMAEGPAWRVENEHENGRVYGGITR
jgi:hypothetical protein